MDVYPNEAEIQQATDLLANKYNVSIQLMGKLLGDKQTKETNYLLRKINGKSPDKYDIATRLVRRKGPELFCGSSQSVKQLRKKILSEIPDGKVIQLFKRNKPLGSTVISSS